MGVVRDTGINVDYGSLVIFADDIVSASLVPARLAKDSIAFIMFNRRVKLLKYEEMLNNSLKKPSREPSLPFRQWNAGWK